MKNVIKKIFAFAMSFTLLGASSALKSSDKQQTDNTVVASAASNNDVTKIFTDVKEGKWYVSAIQFVYDRQIMSGKSANIFATESLLTRGEFATALYNMAGRPKTDYNQIFNDVPPGQWYTDPVLWTYYWGISSGYGNGNYGVSDSITREQLATMLYKYETNFKKRTCSAPTDALKNFSDVSKVSSWALDPMRWAVSQKVISGKSNGTLEPQGTATRAECAQIIKNYLGGSCIDPVSKTYTIKSSNGAKVRNNANISGTQIGALAKGSVVAYDQTSSANGYIWYHIISVDAKSGSWGSYSGWVANV